MKKIIFFLFLIYLPANSQILKGIIIDSQTKEKLPYVNISLFNKNIGTSTNENGYFKFEISKKSSQDSLLISFIGYKDKIIPLKNYTSKISNNIKIELEQKNELLNEVYISDNKKNYSFINHNLGTSRERTFIASVPYGDEIATLIENPREKNGKLVELVLKFKKRSSDQIKVFKTYYRINFYKNNLENGPGELLTYKNIIIKPENKNNKVKLELKNLKIKLPKNGLYIGIEAINPQTNNPTSNLYLTTPNILYTHDDKSLTYGRFRGGEWHEKKRKSVFKKNKFTVPLIDLKVVYEK
ncbi:carboxypeptidase-like regulatory domain-containing protein [Mesonia ostreae]|uniref:Carboxypeptidase-like regulatory domain-containing protein n=1 Tax=Mesonia ostreae TaxID=861110 RepID=A0ABU2KMC4_9FLAO|nr:carboxypeptidase-like regulatory domain-containing protein [Mesonia ostreae]MDT0295876.1 carboxypeptidase-like regulatory domain-containing protein [Mesonia ostreae]